VWARGRGHCLRYISNGNRFVFVLHLMQNRSTLFCKLQVRIGGFRALISGLQADTYLEATHIEKQKLSYDAVQFADATDALVRT
jgi:hypothetical protein